MYRTKEAIRQGIKLYFSSLLVYGLGVLACSSLPYYQQTLNDTTQNILLAFYITYIILAPFIYFFRVSKYSTNKPFLVLRWLINIFQSKKIIPGHEEKNAILFLLVKIFFLPLMTQFFIGNFIDLSRTFTHSTAELFAYSTLLTLIFTIDTLIFSIGYTFESRLLNNIVKSVEPTLFGWAVALICYPPFNSIVGKYIPWGANDHVFFWNDTITIILRIGIIILFTIYVWATLALGLKASNLTNRGIIRRFPYSIVRHPAYISKNLVWWLTLLPVINWKFALGMGFWSVIYFFRAVTEENHLSQDPQYLEYKKKVKWRFIPLIY